MIQFVLGAELIELNFDGDYATNMHAPPAFLIFSSAVCEKYLAFTIIGFGGIDPFPKTLKYPAFMVSTTTAVPVGSEASCSVSGTSDHSLSTLMVGLK